MSVHEMKYLACGGGHSGREHIFSFKAASNDEALLIATLGRGWELEYVKEMVWKFGSDVYDLVNRNRGNTLFENVGDDQEDIYMEDLYFLYNITEDRVLFGTENITEFE